MIEVFKTNDPVRLSYVQAILSEAGVEAVTLDSETAGIFGGALPWIKRRVLVPEADAERARILLSDALGDEDEA